jgi:RimJ/RimL family protein N-acetyltransferase
VEHLTEKYVNWLSDPEVMRYSDQRFKKHTLESCRNYMNSFKGTPNGFWAIVANDRNLGHIGNLTTYVNTVHSVADIGILIGEKRVWGQGYGTEAWIAMCDYLFEITKIRKITVGTLSVNIPMLKIIQKSGMIEDGCRRRQCLFEGREIDMVHAALFREDRKR